MKIKFRVAACAATLAALTVIGGSAATAAQPAPVAPRWSVATGKTNLYVSMGKPGTVVLGTSKTMEIRRTTNGSLVCSTGNYGQATLAPAVDAANNRIYVGTTNGYVLGFNATNCDLNYVASGPGGPALVAYGNGVVAASFPTVYRLYGYSITLSFLWDYAFSVPGAHEPRFIANGTILLANGKYIDAVRSIDGTSIWYRSLPFNLLGRAAAPNDGRVYVSDTGNNVYAYNIATGVLVWSRNMGTTGQLIGSRGLGRLFVTGANGTLYSLNAATGATQCSRAVGGTFNSRAAVDSSSGSTWATNKNGKTYKFTASCGIGWNYATGQYSMSGPAYQQGQNSVYAVGNGRLYSFAK